MEPLPFESGMFRTELPSLALDARFNGAAPFRERNELFFVIHDRRRHASMEPLPFESGMWRACSGGLLSPGMAGFNGAAPFRERNGGLRRGRFALTSRFNGAAPFREGMD